MQTIDIAINAKRTTAHITRRSPQGGAGTTRRYHNVSAASIARLIRMGRFEQVQGVYRAVVTK